MIVHVFYIVLSVTYLTVDPPPQKKKCSVKLGLFLQKFLFLLKSS